MISRMSDSESSCPQIRGEGVDAILKSIYSSCFPALHCRYVDPQARGTKETIETIRRVILDTIHDSPRVLLDMVSGRYCDQSEQLKELPVMISVMEEATGVSVQALMALPPLAGLGDIPVKFCLTLTQQMTLVEGAPHSLLVYGEGLRQELAQLLTSSGDISILSWPYGSFNSCLPTKITVFKQLPLSHIPAVITNTEMDEIIAKLRASSLNLTLVMKLHDRLHKCPVVSFSGQRTKFPCLTFKLGAITATGNAEGRVFRAQTDALGIVNIGTEEDLFRFNHLYLVHPWLDFILDRRPVASGSVMAATNTRAVRFADRFAFPSDLWTAARAEDPGSLPPSSVSQEDRVMRAFQVVARLSQPFGALLLTPDTGKTTVFRRVAAETLIMVQVEEITPAVLNKLISSVHVVTVL